MNGKLGLNGVVVPLHVEEDPNIDKESLKNLKEMVDCPAMEGVLSKEIVVPIHVQVKRNYIFDYIYLDSMKIH